MMNLIKKSIAGVLTSTIAISLSSCATSIARYEKNSNAIAAPTPTEITQSQATLKSLLTETSPPKNTLPVTIYQADDRCETLIPKSVTVPPQRSVEAAVGKVIAQRDTADFSLAGYRVSINQNRVATIDLRLAPSSKRQLVSLSSCEQFALFGSLRKTLTANQTWNIKDVRFTQQGEDIYL
jgi:hypothetical protein